MNKGFTIVELIVSVAIFAVMTALIIGKYGSFNQSTLLTNMAYDMALTIRTAQTYGLSVKSSDAASNIFSSAYGVHFDGGDSQHFILFADANNDKFYGTGEAITTYTLTQGATIKSVCLGTGPSDCPTSVSGTGNSLDIVYRRPNPNALFNVASGVTRESRSDPVALITIQSSDKNHTETLYVRKNGQISVGS